MQTNQQQPGTEQAAIPQQQPAPTSGAASFQSPSATGGAQYPPSDSAAAHPPPTQQQVIVQSIVLVECICILRTATFHRKYRSTRMIRYFSSVSNVILTD